MHQICPAWQEYKLLKTKNPFSQISPHGALLWKEQMQYLLNDYIYYLH